MNPGHRIVRALAVYAMPARHPEVFVVLEVPDRNWLGSMDFWLLDPPSGSIWRVANLAHVDTPSPNRDCVGLMPVSGSGKLVEGLELHMVPIGWQP